MLKLHTLEEKKRKLIFRKKRPNHIKRKIDVPFEQGMDNGGEDEEAGQVRWAAEDVSRRRKASKTSIGDSGGEEEFGRGPGLVSPRRSQHDEKPI